jgi:hypothetical protein
MSQFSIEELRINKSWQTDVSLSGSLRRLRNVEWNVRLVMNDESVRIWKVANVPYFKVPSQGLR